MKNLTLVTFLFCVMNSFSQVKCNTYELSFNDTTDTIRTIKAMSEFDNMGREIVTNYYQYGTVTYHSENKFNSSGKLVRETSKSFEKSICVDSSVTDYLYDKRGRLKKETTREQDKMTSWVRYFYHKKDTLLKKE